MVVEAGDGNFHLIKKKYHHERGNKLEDLFRLLPSSSSLSIWKRTLAVLIFDQSISINFHLIFHSKLLLLLKIETLIFIHGGRDRSCLSDKQAARASTFVIKKREGAEVGDRILIDGLRRKSEGFFAVCFRPSYRSRNLGRSINCSTHKVPQWNPVTSEQE